MGYTHSDVQIAACWKGEKRTSAGIVPYSKQIDTLAATFPWPRMAVCTMKSWGWVGAVVRGVRRSYGYLWVLWIPEIKVHIKTPK